MQTCNTLDFKVSIINMFNKLHNKMKNLIRDLKIVIQNQMDWKIHIKNLYHQMGLTVDSIKLKRISEVEYGSDGNIQSEAWREKTVEIQIEKDKRHMVYGQTLTFM